MGEVKNEKFKKNEEKKQKHKASHHKCMGGLTIFLNYLTANILPRFLQLTARILP